jgi:hypothetical protein
LQLLLQVLEIEKRLKKGDYYQDQFHCVRLLLLVYDYNERHALLLMAYDMEGVYALERVHACREYDRGATPCCHGAVSGAL